METSRILLLMALVLFVSSVPFIVLAARRGQLDRRVIVAAALMDSAAIAIIVGVFVPSGAARTILFTVPWPLILAAGWLLWQHREHSGG